MPNLPLVTQPYGRPTFGLPVMRLVNMYMEPTEQGPGQFALLPRHALIRRFACGDGPVRGMFWASGVSDSAVFICSGDGLYRKGVRLGDVHPGTSIARFAATASQVGLVVGGQLWCYDTSTHALTQVTKFSDNTTDLPAFSDILVLSERFYLLQQDSDQWYFSALDDLTSIDVLSFETTEAAPDANVGAAVLGDEVWFFGKETVEPWSETGDANAPLAASQGRTYGHGCAAQGSIVALDNSLFWLGADKMVYRSGTVPVRISDHGVEEMLRKSPHLDKATAFFTVFDGHSFYVLNVPEITTLAYDVSTQRWSEWRSRGLQHFRIGCGVYTTDSANGETWLGDFKSGQIWKFDPSARDENPVAGGKIQHVPVTKVVSGGAAVGSGVERCDVISLQMVRGDAVRDTADAVVEMRYSDKAGAHWATWKPRTLKRSGGLHKATWRQLGAMRAPGRIFEFRTDEVVTFLGATINEHRP